MSAAFLDTVGLLALWDEADQWHARAESAWQRLVAARSSLISTTYVLLECGNAAARRPYRNQVNRLRFALSRQGELASPTEAEIERAWDAYDGGDAGGAGIVDHVSFQVMRRLGLTQAFTNDKHFEAAGFETLF